MQSSMKIHMEANEECRRATFELRTVPKTNQRKCRDIITVELSPSQIEPENIESASNIVTVNYIGAQNIWDRNERHIMSSIYRKFKQFINNRDDVFWKKA